MNNGDKNPQEAGKEPKWPANPDLGSKKSSDPSFKSKDKSYFQKESVEEKVRESLRNFKNAKNMEQLYGYARQNKEQTVSYVLMIIGIILLLFTPYLILGELLIGLVAGYHFSAQIISYLQSFSNRFTTQWAFQNTVIIVLVLTIFIMAPGLVIGAVAAAGLKEALERR
ncbi:MAG: hypothetical protein LW832_01900 [Parachlamydia sp.]|jgi:hypothetical protein|nr:hypothetical protein [Parachlamydia sp.]